MAPIDEIAKITNLAALASAVSAVALAIVLYLASRRPRKSQKKNDNKRFSPTTYNL